MMHKIKVLSADDEYWSRENIRNLIPWEEHSIEFLEPACDGEEVLERIETERPDIVLTDINMPFVGGLELLEKIQTNHPEIITIAISGYDDFCKVKGVFLSGGIDYLLKPVGKEQLVETLSKALRILEQREREQQRQNNSWMRENYVSSFLEDGEFSELLNTKLYKPGAYVHVSSTKVFSEVSTILIKIHDVEILKKKFGHDVLKMSYSIKKSIRSLIDNKDAMVFHYNDKISEFLLILTEETGRLRRLAKDIHRTFPEEEWGPITIVIHDQASSLDDIGTVYRDMIARLVLRPFNHSHYLTMCGQEISEEQPASRYTDRTKTLLCAALKAGNLKQAQETVLKHSGFAASHKNKWSLFEVTQFTTGVLNTIAEQDLKGAVTDFEELQDAVNYGVRLLNLQMILDNISIALKMACNTDNTSINGSITRQVENVRDYILKHYAEHLTLTGLGEIFYVDASYLSRVFPRKYGETITTCITRCRIEKAQELMKDPSNKLEAISFEVGYDDYNYFSRVFKRFVGASPSEWRKNIQ